MRVKPALLLFALSLQALGFENENNDNIETVGDGSKRISSLNVLLPTSGCADCRKAVHNITAQNGCYSW